MRVGSGVILFQLAGFLTSALADFYFAKHTHPSTIRRNSEISLAPVKRSGKSVTSFVWRMDSLSSKLQSKDRPITVSGWATKNRYPGRKS